MYTENMQYNANIKKLYDDSPDWLKNNIINDLKASDGYSLNLLKGIGSLKQNNSDLYLYLCDYLEHSVFINAIAYERGLMESIRDDMTHTNQINHYVSNNSQKSDEQKIDRVKHAMAMAMYDNIIRSLGSIEKKAALGFASKAGVCNTRADMSIAVITSKQQELIDSLKNSGLKDKLPQDFQRGLVVKASIQEYDPQKNTCFMSNGDHVVCVVVTPDSRTQMDRLHITAIDEWNNNHNGNIRITTNNQWLHHFKDNTIRYHFNEHHGDKTHSLFTKINKGYKKSRYIVRGIIPDNLRGEIRGIQPIINSKIANIQSSQVDDVFNDNRLLGYDQWPNTPSNKILDQEADIASPRSRVQISEGKHLGAKDKNKFIFINEQLDQNLISCIEEDQEMS
ncbi:hypothetical protein L3V83_05475 [Thiotrichales bacterium 19X7-9]|nr:hypothetical protein [Thiotrichales bacterium 19X7-9]